MRLTVGKDQVLQESTIRFEILQEYSSDGKGERITLGVLSLNLSEYVGDEQDTPIAEGQRSVTRRYLMQESKINSTLKIEIEMKHVKGDKNYTVYVLCITGAVGLTSTQTTAQNGASFWRNRGHYDL